MDSFFCDMQITLTSTMIVLHITKKWIQLFAEQLQAVHRTFYTFMLFQHVKKQLDFMSMHYQPILSGNKGT